jgi:hypothetical protein
MNLGTLINLGSGTRAGGMLCSAGEPDISTIDIDALLAETSEAEVERQQMRLVKEAKAQNVVNTLQKVTFIHIIYDALQTEHLYSGWMTIPNWPTSATGIEHMLSCSMLSTTVAYGPSRCSSIRSCLVLRIPPLRLWHEVALPRSTPEHIAGPRWR